MGALPALTKLPAQNKGAFPKDQVPKVIRGEVSTQTHGLKDMPVWGSFFLSLNNSQEPEVHIRVANLTSHIEHLQAK